VRSASQGESENQAHCASQLRRGNQVRQASHSRRENHIHYAYERSTNAAVPMMRGASQKIGENHEPGASQGRQASQKGRENQAVRASHDCGEKPYPVREPEVKREPCRLREPKLERVTISITRARFSARNHTRRASQVRGEKPYQMSEPSRRREPEQVSDPLDLNETPMNKACSTCKFWSAQIIRRRHGGPIEAQCLQEHPTLGAHYAGRWTVAHTQCPAHAEGKNLDG